MPIAPAAPAVGVAAPPPPPMTLSPSNLVQCRLLDPASESIDVCLIDAIADTQAIATPYCPASSAEMPIGDLAFAILADRHPGLWESALPRELIALQEKNGSRAFSDWVSQRKNRQMLQKAVRKHLSAGRRRP